MKPHTDLECPVCDKICRPYHEHKDGGYTYYCYNIDSHPDFNSLKFIINRDGELDY